MVHFETLVLGNAWLSWETGKWIVLLCQGDDVTVSVLLPVLVLGLVSCGVLGVQCSGEGIWGDLLEFVLFWKSGVHSVLLEEPLELVDG